MFIRLLVFTIGFIAFGFASSANAAIVHDEAVDGDLSTDNTSPTSLNFSIGPNTVIGNVDDAQGSGNVDVFTFNVPNGAQWTSMTLDTYVSSDNVAFLGIDDTDSFPYNTFELGQVDFGFLPADAFIGGTTFGPFDVGNNILPRAGNIVGSRFTPPLPGGDYTIYVQQTGSASTDYSLTFSLISAVPEPGSATLILAVGSVVALRRRRR